MAYFKYAYGPLNIQELPIAAGTAIERGEIVLFTPATGVAAVAGTDFDDPAIGVAVEAHDGSTAGRQSGTVIKVSTHPDTVYSLRHSDLATATGGSTTTFVDSSILPTTDNIWIGGYLQVVSCAADASQNGRMIPITDSTGTGGTITVATQPAAFAAGDTAILHMGKLGIGEYGWDLTSDGTDIDYDTNGGEAIVLVDTDAERGLTFWKLRLSQFGDHPVAL